MKNTKPMSSDIGPKQQCRGFDICNNYIDMADRVWCGGCLKDDYCSF